MKNALHIMILTGLAIPFSSMANLVVNIYEQGGSTFVEASGTLDLSGEPYEEVEVTENGISVVGFDQTSTIGSGIEPQEGVLLMFGSNLDLPMTMFLYQSTSTPTAFGDGGETTTTNYTGNSSPGFGLLSDSDFFFGILVEETFTGSKTFNQEMIFVDSTLEDLGIDLGSSTWEWDNEATATINVIGVIPEPATWTALAGATAFGLALLRRRLRTRG